jgi:hypothetical protein
MAQDILANRPIKAPKQLLVEGRTAEMFFREATGAINLQQHVEVRNFGGIDDLDGYIRMFQSLKEFRANVASLGIIRDAELSASAAFQSVCRSLRKAELSIPAEMNTITEDTPRIGVYILPDCRNPGMLETLCWNSLETDSGQDRHLNCAKQYIECCQSAGVETRNEAKAKLWTYLAAFGKFEPQIGRASQQKVWNWQSPQFSSLFEFLKRL